MLCFSGELFYDLLYKIRGARWRSGRVLDLRSKGRGFEIQRRHCVVSLSKTLYPLLNTGMTHDVRKSSRHDRKLLTWT